MLVLKTVYRDGKAFLTVVEGGTRACTLCGRQIHSSYELCTVCEWELDKNQDDQQLQEETR